MKPHAYLHLDAAAHFLRVSPRQARRIANTDHWRRLRDGHAWIYLLADIRTTERKRRHHA